MSRTNLQLGYLDPWLLTYFAVHNAIKFVSVVFIVQPFLIENEN